MKYFYIVIAIVLLSVLIHFISTKFLNVFLNDALKKMTNDGLFKETDKLEVFLNNLDNNSSLIDLKKYKFRSELNEYFYDDMQVITFGNQNKSKKTILFVHGGGWIFNLDEKTMKFCDKLAYKEDYFIIVPIYKLCPKNDFLESLDELVSFYENITKQFKDVILMGDSAGGNYIISMLIKAFENKLIMPKLIVAMSPVVDLSYSNETEVYKKLENKDPIFGIEPMKLISKIISKDRDLKDYRFSPYFFNGYNSSFPKIIITVGENEIFKDDIVRYYQKLKSLNVNCDMYIGKSLLHDFLIYSLLPVYDIKKIYKAIKKEIGKF